MKKSIVDLIDQSSGLYAIPEIYSILNAKLKDPYTSNTQIADIIQRDPGLTLTLLKIVNSAFYGFESTVSTVSRAISILGRNEISTLAFSTSTIHVFNKLPIKKSVLYEHWQHSLLCGLIAKQIGKHSAFAEQSDALFIAGLLHDVGRLVLWHKLPQESEQIAVKLQQRPHEEIEIESEVLGFTHADIGAALMRLWKVPPLLIATTQWHHSPDRSVSYIHECQLINMATLLAELTTGQEITLELLEQHKEWDIFNLNVEAVVEIQSIAKEQMREMIGMFLS